MNRKLPFPKSPAWRERAAGIRLFALAGLCVGFLLLLSAGGLTYAQDETTRTPDPRSTIWTPPPARYAVQLIQSTLIDELRFDRPGLGTLAVDPTGALYVGDGLGTVLVFSPELTELRLKSVSRHSARHRSGSAATRLAERSGPIAGTIRRSRIGEPPEVEGDRPV